MVFKQRRQPYISPELAQVTPVLKQLMQHKETQVDTTIAERSFDIMMRGYSLGDPPRNVFSDEMVTDLSDAASIRRRLERNFYFQEYSRSRRRELIRTVQSLSDVPDYVKDVVLPRHGFNQQLVNLSVYGGYPYLPKGMPTRDIDLMAVLSGGGVYRYTPAEDNPLPHDHPLQKKLERKVKGLDVLVIGEDDLVLGPPQAGYPKEPRIVDMIVGGETWRNIVLRGREFAARHDPQSSLTKAAYLTFRSFQRLYKMYMRPKWLKETEFERHKLVIGMLTEANLLIDQIHPEFKIDFGRLFRMPKKLARGRLKPIELERQLFATADRVFQLEKIEKRI
ncbi:MAG: hypothetical protein ABH950_00985 [Candidatus Altiarchaeota archaeon]